MVQVEPKSPGLSPEIMLLKQVGSITISDRAGLGLAMRSVRRSDL